MALIIMGGTLLLVVPGIYLMLSYALVWPVGVIERRFGMAALRRSLELTRGHLLRVTGILFVAALLVLVVGRAAEFALAYLPLLGGPASAVVDAIGAAFYGIVMVVLYLDVRCRKEAFDLEDLSAEVEGQRAAPSAAPVG